MMNDLEFENAVRTMRMHQKDYFRTRLPKTLTLSKEWEKRVDKELVRRKLRDMPQQGRLI